MQGIEPAVLHKLKLENYLSMKAIKTSQLLQYIDSSAFSAEVIYQSLLRQIESTGSEKIDHLTILQTQCRALGLSTSLPAENTLLYAEHSVNAPHTLLFIIGYDSSLDFELQLPALAAYFSAFSLYQNCGEIHPINVQWLFGDVQNLTLAALSTFAQRQQGLRVPDGCIWYDCRVYEELLADRLFLATGTKGCLSVEMTAQTASTPLPSFYGGIVPNAAWRLLWAVNSLKDVREEVLIEGFYDMLEDFEDESVSELIAISENTDNNLLSRLQWGVPNFLFNLQGMQQYYAHFLMPTCTLTDFQSPPLATAEGLSHSAFSSSIPPQARAYVDFHLVPQQTPEKVFSLLQDHLRKHNFSDIQLTLRAAYPPARTSSQNSFVQMVSQAIQQTQQVQQEQRQKPYLLPMLASPLPLFALRSVLDIPVVMLPFMNRRIDKATQNSSGQAEILIQRVKQAALILAGFAELDQ